MVAPMVNSTICHTCHRPYGRHWELCNLGEKVYLDGSRGVCPNYRQFLKEQEDKERISLC